MRNCVSILLILFILFPRNSQAENLSQAKLPLGEPTSISPQLVERQAARVKRSRMRKLMGVLGIKSGMTIVDIGAGSGAYAYKFAERLKGTGRVFATDIDTNMIRFLNEQVRAKNLTNLFPVLVKGEGLDEFYTKEKFDLVFVAHTYSYMHDRVNFFKRLKDSFSQNERLVVLHPKNWSDFCSSDISNLDGLIKKLSSEEYDSPFYSHLQESTRRLLQEPSEDKELLKKAIIGDFNRMIKDMHFLSHFLKDGLMFKKGIHFTADESSHVRDLLKLLRNESKMIDDKGVPNIGKMTRRDIWLIKGVNTIIIVQEFRKFLYNGRPAPYLPHGYGNWRNQAITDELASAGYSLKYQYDFIPFDLIYVFSPDKNAD